MKPHQQSQKEHGGDRMKTRAHKEVEHILGREVEYAFNCTYRDGKEECADCKQPAKYLIVEKGLDDNNDLRSWYYCGVCEVG
jgi:hypothetical protein